ncbi:MAG: DUF4317 family protein [bacterium]
MNTKPYAALKRKLRFDRTTLTNLVGYYINENREVVASFEEDIVTLGEEEGTKLLGIFKKLLSGKSDRNGFYVGFPTSAVREKEAGYALLAALRETALEDAGLREALVERIRENLELEGDYLILMAYDVYDVFDKSEDALPGEKSSRDQFRHYYVAICPAKLPKTPLTFSVQKEKFVSASLGSVVGAPEVGFLFPAFTDGATDLYGALYYNKSRAETHEGFYRAMFGTDPAPAPDEQKESFTRLVSDTLGDDCTYDTYCAVREELKSLTAGDEESGRKGDPYVSPHEVGFALERTGLEKERVERFEREMKEEFQGQSALLASNLLELEKLTLEIEGTAVIQLSKEKAALLEVRQVDGMNCVVLKVDGPLTVNGFPVK